MKKTREQVINRKELTATGVPMCDGCCKEIATDKRFWRFSIRNAGDHNWGNYHTELDSHQTLLCEAKVMRLVWEMLA